MPIRRKDRGKIWSVKTQPDKLQPVLQSKHEFASQKIAIAFASIDQYLNRVKAILDSRGIILSQRGLYRSLAEQLWRIRKKYSGQTQWAESQAICVKYFLYGCDLNIVEQIANLIGISIKHGLVVFMTDIIEKQLKEALEEAYTLTCPEVAQNPVETSFEYDVWGRITKMTIKDLVTGKMKIKYFTYDELGNLIDIREEKVG